MPCVRRPFTKPGRGDADDAMKILRPTEFMNHTVGDGSSRKTGVSSETIRAQACDKRTRSRQRQWHSATFKTAHRSVRPPQYRRR